MSNRLHIHCHKRLVGGHPGLWLTQGLAEYNHTSHTRVGRESSATTRTHDGASWHASFPDARPGASAESPGPNLPLSFACASLRIGAHSPFSVDLCSRTGGRATPQVWSQWCNNLRGHTGPLVPYWKRMTVHSLAMVACAPDLRTYYPPPVPQGFESGESTHVAG